IRATNLLDAIPDLARCGRIESELADEQDGMLAPPPTWIARTDFHFFHKLKFAFSGVPRMDFAISGLDGAEKTRATSRKKSVKTRRSAVKLRIVCASNLSFRNLLLFQILEMFRAPLIRRSF